MSTFKQVHNKFWQNDFVLGLTAEERYFYIYLITNSMTNQCGIFKFNRRLAELETGYTIEKIEKFLGKFQDFGKVVISQITTEIMIVNWFKHNFKINKKNVILINKELNDVKDTVLLKKLYDSCSSRKYPVSEIFNGIILPGVETAKDNLHGKVSPEAAIEIQKEVKGCVEQEEENTEVSTAPEQSFIPEELLKTDSIMFNSFTLSTCEEANLDSEVEEVCVTEDCLEYDSEEIEEGTIIASWEFTNEDISQPFRGRFYDDVAAVRNTA